MPNAMLRSFSSFCTGIGGFRLGLEGLGLECRYSCEINSQCQETYRANFGSAFGASDIGDVDPSGLPQFDLFCAGFPCQPYSIAGKRRGFSDPRSDVFPHILRLVRRSSPSVVLLENVRHLVHHHKGMTLQSMLRALVDEGYFVNWAVLDSMYFGVAQSRPRLFIVGFKSKEAHQNFSFPNNQNVSKVLRDVLTTGYAEHPLSKRWLEYLELYSRKRSEEEVSFKIPKTRTSLEKKPPPGVSLDDCILQIRSSGIRAIPIDRPSPTFAVSVSGGGAMIPVHVRERRHLNLLEMKRIMGFPDDFLFPVSRTNAIKQLANSVCPPVITEIGRNIIEAFDRRIEPRTQGAFRGYHKELAQQLTLTSLDQ